MSSVNNLPYEQFKALGFEKKDVLALPSLTLEALLNGKRSHLMSFNSIQLNNGLTLSNITGRLSLEKQPDGNYNLKIHTKQPVTPNKIEETELTKQQLQQLKSKGSPILVVKVKDKAGFAKDMLVQYDRQLNDINFRPLDSGRREINGYQLSDQQRVDFAEGRQIKTPDGDIKRNLISPLGYKASFLVLGAAMVMPSVIVAAVAASILAMKQFNKTLSPSANRPYRSYDDSGIIKDYIHRANTMVENLRKPENAQQLTKSLSETLDKFDTELAELSGQYKTVVEDESLDMSLNGLDAEEVSRGSQAKSEYGPDGENQLAAKPEDNKNISPKHGGYKLTVK